MKSRANRQELAFEILPFLRGRVCGQRRWIAGYRDTEDVLQFVNSAHGKDLAFLAQAARTISSAQRYDRCLCHGPTIKILKRSRNRLTSPLLSIARTIETTIKSTLLQIRRPCEIRPSIVLIPGLGMFSFGKNKTEARITRRVLCKRNSRNGGSKPSQRRRCL